MLVICILVPIIEGATAGPEAAFVVPAPIVRMLPPCQMQEPRKGHEMTTSVGKQDFELLVSIGAREPHALHTQIDRHGVGARLM